MYTPVFQNHAACGTWALWLKPLGMLGIVICMVNIKPLADVTFYKLYFDHKQLSRYQTVSAKYVY